MSYAIIRNANYKKENNLQGRIIKTTNVACEFIITSDREFFERIGEEETKRYFQTAYDFVANYKNLGKKYILSAKVHMDESAPHMHLVFVPVIHKLDNKSEKQIDKIACSEYWKGKDSYRQLQDAFYKHITNNGFDLERGQSKGAKHIDTETLKQITNYDNINNPFILYLIIMDSFSIHHIFFPVLNILLVSDLLLLSYIFPLIYT